MFLFRYSSGKLGREKKNKGEREKQARAFSEAMVVEVQIHPLSFSLFNAKESNVECNYAYERTKEKKRTITKRGTKWHTAAEQGEKEGADASFFFFFFASEAMVVEVERLDLLPLSFFSLFTADVQRRR